MIVKIDNPDGADLQSVPLEQKRQAL